MRVSFYLFLGGFSNRMKQMRIMMARKRTMTVLEPTSHLYRDYCSTVPADSARDFSEFLAIWVCSSSAPTALALEMTGMVGRTIW